MIYDPALGASRAYRSGVVTQNAPASKKLSTLQWRNINKGMFSGPRPSYQGYNGNENSKDILNRSKRNMDMR